WGTLLLHKEQRDRAAAGAEEDSTIPLTSSAKCLAAVAGLSSSSAVEAVSAATVAPAALISATICKSGWKKRPPVAKRRSRSASSTPATPAQAAAQRPALAPQPVAPAADAVRSSVRAVSFRSRRPVRPAGAVVRPFQTHAVNAAAKVGRKVALASS